MVTVGELKKMLKKFDDDLVVVQRGYEDGSDDIGEIKEAILRKQERLSWYNGTYQDKLDIQKGDIETRVLLLGFAG